MTRILMVKILPSSRTQEKGEFPVAHEADVRIVQEDMSLLRYCPAVSPPEAPP